MLIPGRQVLSESHVTYPYQVPREYGSAGFHVYLLNCRQQAMGPNFLPRLWIGYAGFLPVRELCRALGDLASTCIEKLIYAARIKARKPLTIHPQRIPLRRILRLRLAIYWTLFEADFGFLAIKGEARTIGRLFAYDEAIVLLQYIWQRNLTSIFSSHNLTKDCEEIPYAPGFETISGMLVIPLTLSSSDFLVFFRKTQVFLPQHFTQYNGLIQ